MQGAARKTEVVTQDRQRQDRARRMRLFATGLLLLMAGSFIALRRLAVLHPAWDPVLG